MVLERKRLLGWGRTVRKRGEKDHKQRYNLVNGSKCSWETASSASRSDRSSPSRDLREQTDTRKLRRSSSSVLSRDGGKASVAGLKH